MKSPKRICRPRAEITTSPAVSGGIVSRLWPSRRSGGSRARKASSRLAVPLRARSSAGVPVASTRPLSTATSQSYCSASSM